MPIHPFPRLSLLAALALCAAACAPPSLPFARLAGLVTDKRLDEIRAELGLTIPVPRRPLPEGFRKRYHTTLGNMKDLSTGS